MVHPNFPLITGIEIAYFIFTKKRFLETSESDLTLLISEAEVEAYRPLN
jgi:hypothetical protein